MAEIAVINPRFEVSYWGMEHALPLIGKRANLPVAALPLLAALTPGEHTITLLDENVDAIDYRRLAGADIASVLSTCIAVDWHAPAAAPGHAVQTSFHHVPVLLLRTGEASCDLVAPRSFARSLHDWLVDR